jgi:hypothetical protein
MVSPRKVRRDLKVKVKMEERNHPEHIPISQDEFLLPVVLCVGGGDTRKRGQIGFSPYGL